MKYFSFDEKFWQYAWPSLVVFIISALYLVYLSLIAQAIIVNDSIGYEALGRKMLQGGLSAYLKDGLTREPLYPFLISRAMSWSEATGIDYHQIQKWIQISFLMTTQVLVFVLLKRICIRRWLTALVVLCVGMTPTLINSTMWTFSEVVTYPFMICLILLCSQSWVGLKEQNNLDGRTAAKAIAVGICCIILTMVKAAFELVVPVIFTVFVVWAIVHYVQKRYKSFVVVLLFVCIAATTYYAAITWYKWFNWKQNGYFALTDRGPWALYGFTERRMQPMNMQRFEGMVAFIPGPEFCYKVSDNEACDAWSIFPGNSIAENYLKTAGTQFPTQQLLDRQLVNMSFHRIMENPGKFFILMYFESFKALFWASDYNAQVAYPDWLEGVYRNRDFFMGVTFVLALMTACAYVYFFGWVIRLIKDILNNNTLTILQAAVFFIFIVTNVFIAAYAVIHVSPRDTLPMVPLYLIMIAVCLEQILTQLNF
jgi:hypothetical protein